MFMVLKWITAICVYVSRYLKHKVEWKSQVGKWYIQYDITYVKFKLLKTIDTLFMDKYVKIALKCTQYSSSEDQAMGIRSGKNNERTSNLLSV